MPQRNKPNAKANTNQPVKQRPGGVKEEAQVKPNPNQTVPNTKAGTE